SPAGKPAGFLRGMVSPRSVSEGATSRCKNGRRLRPSPSPSPTTRSSGSEPCNPSSGSPACRGRFSRPSNLFRVLLRFFPCHHLRPLHPLQDVDRLLVAAEQAGRGLGRDPSELRLDLV